MPMPSEPGWWWGYLGPDCAPVPIDVVEYEEGSGKLGSYHNEMWYPVSDTRWLEPVVTPEQRRQAVEALECCVRELSGVQTLHGIDRDMHATALAKRAITALQEAEAERLRKQVASSGKDGIAAGIINGVAAKECDQC